MLPIVLFCTYMKLLFSKASGTGLLFILIETSPLVLSFQPQLLKIKVSSYTISEPGSMFNMHGTVQRISSVAK